MILKIKSHKKSFHDLLEYMLHDKDRLFDREGKSFIVTYNLKGNNINEWEMQFKENETYRTQRRKDNVLLTHEILSWHRDDAKDITLKKLEEMTREYIKLRNPNGLYIAVPHFDKGHYHVHVCASGIEYHNGKSLRLSKAELQKLKKNIQNYQVEKYPELSHSIVEHGGKNKSLVTEKEYQHKHRTGRESEKEKIIETLQTCYKKVFSKESFFELLNESGLSSYSRGGKVTGILYQGRKFRFSTLGFTDEKLKELDKSIEREKELRRLRENGNEKSKERGIER